MNIITIYDDGGQYILGSLRKSITKKSISFIYAGHVHPLENFQENIKNAPFDAFLVAISKVHIFERVLATIRRISINKPVFIVKISTMARGLPIMDEHETFLNNRIERLNGGGGKKNPIWFILKRIFAITAI